MSGVRQLCCCYSFVRIARSTRLAIPSHTDFAGSLESRRWLYLILISSALARKNWMFNVLEKFREVVLMRLLVIWVLFTCTRGSSLNGESGSFLLSICRMDCCLTFTPALDSLVWFISVSLNHHYITLDERCCVVQEVRELTNWRATMRNAFIAALTSSRISEEVIQCIK